MCNSGFTGPRCEFGMDILQKYMQIKLTIPIASVIVNVTFNNDAPTVVIQPNENANPKHVEFKLSITEVREIDSEGKILQSYNLNSLNFTSVDMPGSNWIYNYSLPFGGLFFLTFLDYINN